MTTMKKEDTTLAIGSTESVFITSNIDSFEGRKVATMNIPIDFLHTPMYPKYLKVHITLQVKLKYLMVKVDPKFYRKLVRNGSKGCMIFYVEIQKFLERILKSVLLLYMNLVGYLTRASFKINLYDPCAMNKVLWGE